MKLARLIEEHYDLGPVELGEPLEGGYANDVMRLDAGGVPYVLRIKHPPVAPESIAWEHRFVEQLPLDVVPVPIRARDGSSFFLHDRFAVWLLPFAAGRVAAHEDGIAVARALGRIHAAASELRLPQRPTMRPIAVIEWPPARLPAELAAWLPALEAGREWAIEWSRSHAEPVGPIHGDFFPGNVLVDGERVSAVLDWEEARLDWPAIDVAAGIWHFAARGTEVDRPAAAAFLAAYRESGGVVNASCSSLLPFIRAKRVLEVLRAPTDRHVDWSYQLHNLQAVERLAKT